MVTTRHIIAGCVRYPTSGQLPPGQCRPVSATGAVWVRLCGHSVRSALATLQAACAAVVLAVGVPIALAAGAAAVLDGREVLDGLGALATVAVDLAAGDNFNKQINSST